MHQLFELYLDERENDGAEALGIARRALDAKAEHTSSGDVDPQVEAVRTQTEMIAHPFELNQVDPTLLKTTPALRHPGSVDQSLLSTQQSLDVSEVRDSQAVDQSLRETNPMGNVVFRDHKLIEPKPHQAPRHTRHGPSFQLNPKKALNPPSSFILPYASAWWVFPLTMVLLVIIYFIWF